MNDDSIDDHAETPVIEQCVPTKTRKQANVMDAIRNHGRVDSDGSLDIKPALQYIDAQRGYAEETFGKYGRIANYTITVDESEVEVVREPSNRGGDVQKAVLTLIQEYATIRSNGTIDATKVEDKEKPDGKPFASKTIMRNVGRACRVNVPREHYPDELQEDIESASEPITDTDSEQIDVGGTFDDPVLNELFTERDVPADPVNAFKRGWRLRDVLTRDEVMNE